MKLFVGNLPFRTTNAELEAAFRAIGQVDSAKVMIDRESQRSRGFGFVEMPDADARRAIKEMNDSAFEGRTLTVNEARPMQGRSDGGSPGYSNRSNAGVDRESSSRSNRNGERG